MEEFERLEGELKGLYEQYFIRIRCLDALRMQVASRVKLPIHQMTMPVIMKQSAEMSLTFLPDGLIDSDDELDDDNENFKLKTDKRDLVEDVTEPRAATRLRIRTAG